MNLKVLGENIALTAAAAQAAVQVTGTTPFLERKRGVLTAQTVGLTGAATFKVQSSDDNVAWTDEIVIAADAPVKKVEVSVRQYYRTNVTAAGTAGVGSAYLEADD